MIENHPATPWQCLKFFPSIAPGNLMELKAFLICCILPAKRGKEARASRFSFDLCFDRPIPPEVGAEHKAGIWADFKAASLSSKQSLEHQGMQSQKPNRGCAGSLASFGTGFPKGQV